VELLSNVNVILFACVMEVTSLLFKSKKSKAQRKSDVGADTNPPAKSNGGSANERATAAAQEPLNGGPEVKLEITTSRQFVSWLAEQKINLAFTTYQAGKLFLLGVKPNGQLSVFNRTLERCMGLACADDSLYVASLFQIYKFVDAARRQPIEGIYDSLFVPQVSYFTGDVDAHDLAVQKDGRLVFVNTLFSCLAEVSETHSFKPVWQPPFIDRLAAEDRCHLNGVALLDGSPRFVTAVANTNVVDGWRDHRGDGGIVIDTDMNQIVLAGLSMPHTPRMRGNALWLHNSGTGYFGRADLQEGTFEPVAFCPGYLRGLDFVGKFAVIGLSKSRENRTFSGLALDDNLRKYKVEPRCGLYVIDLETGDVVHWVRLEGVVTELYDVVVLPNRKNSAIVGFRSDEIRRVVSIDYPASK
jgi:uncharacterized protein (TIGR03032 family)